MDIYKDFLKDAKAKGRLHFALMAGAALIIIAYWIILHSESKQIILQYIDEHWILMPVIPQITGITCTLLICWGLFSLFRQWIVRMLDNIFREQISVAIYWTLIEVLQMVASICSVLFTVSLFYNENSETNSIVYYAIGLTIVAYVVEYIVSNLYYKNRKLAKQVMNNSSGYFDMNDKEIFDKDYVIYKLTIWQINCLKKDSPDEEWIISECRNNYGKYISLKSALEDEKGALHKIVDKLY